MNKKILVLAFISAAFLFSCSADGTFNPSSQPPDWSGIPSNAPSTGNDGSGSSCGSLTGNCCVFHVDLGGGVDACLCAEMVFSDIEDNVEEDCYRFGEGTIQPSCPSGCYGS